MSNPEVVHTSPLIQFHRKWNEGDEVEWPYGIELIDMCGARDNKYDADGCSACHGLCPEVNKLARLLPTESAYKEFETAGTVTSMEPKTIVTMKTVESSEPQEKRTIEDVKNSVAINAGLKDWDEVYKRILPSQIDPLVNQAIRWSIELYKTKLVSAPSESQEEMWREVYNIICGLQVDRNGNEWFNHIEHRMKKRFTITRNP